MEKIYLLAFLLLLFQPLRSGTSLRLPLGVGNAGDHGGGDDGSVWLGVGGSSQNDSSYPSGSVGSDLNNAYTTLQAWKSAMSDDPNKILETWVGLDVCSYRGIFCSVLDGSSSPVVSGIDLNHGNLQGNLVKELSFLTDMSLLHLNSNRFSGTIPDTFKDLVSLQELDLSNNQFSGSFPMVTLQIPNLVYLDLRFNSFLGPIPDELFNRRLDAIFLNNNQFDSQIPDNLGNSPASVINLANNNFSGTLPASFGMMGSKLKEILFLNNRLTGCIPQSIGVLTEMQVLDISQNSLMGHLPDSISCLSQIEVLNLEHNELSGLVSDMICSLKSLMNLTVSFNYFSGFSQQCSKHFSGNVGFNFSLNCIPGSLLQRPGADCSVIPGGHLNCIRIPSVQPAVCGSVASLGRSSP